MCGRQVPCPRALLLQTGTVLGREMEALPAWYLLPPPTVVHISHRCWLGDDVEVPSPEGDDSGGRGDLLALELDDLGAVKEKERVRGGKRQVGASGPCSCG